MAGGWDSGLLQHVTDLNHALLLRLVEAAAAECSVTDMPLAARLRPAWLQLKPGQLAQLAGCPYVLVDAQFGATERWALLLKPDAVAPVAAVREPSSRRPLASTLIRRLLVLAWHLTRVNPLAARILFGMSETCVELMSASRLETLEALAEARPEWIRPLWEDRPDIWQQLLAAALADQGARLQPLQLRGLQLLAGRQQPVRASP